LKGAKTWSEFEKLPNAVMPIMAGSLPDHLDGSMNLYGQHRVQLKLFCDSPAERLIVLMNSRAQFVRRAPTEQSVLVSPAGFSTLRPKL